MYQCLIQLYQQGYTLKELLNHMYPHLSVESDHFSSYKEYGYNITRNSYIMSPNSEYTERVFQKFRNNGDYVYFGLHLGISLIDSKLATLLCAPFVI